MSNALLRTFVHRLYRSQELGFLFWILCAFWAMSLNILNLHIFEQLCVLYWRWRFLDASTRYWTPNLGWHSTVTLTTTPLQEVELKYSQVFCAAVQAHVVILARASFWPMLALQVCVDTQAPCYPCLRARVSQPFHLQSSPQSLWNAGPIIYRHVD